MRKLKGYWILILIALSLVVVLTIAINGFKKANPGFGLKASMEGLTKKNLTRLVPAVEMYKMINGKYPDSLQQVNYAKDPSDIIDTKLFPKNGPVILYYKNMGDTYQLFSTGFDNIPYTVDDVHPDFSAIDTTKLGITLKRK